MELNNKTIFALIIIVVVIIVAIGAVFTSGFFDATVSETTPFDNNFMSGDFVGQVKTVNDSEKWAVAYSDETHHIDYNMSTCKNATLLVDIYTLQGMEGPEHRTFNNQQWDIYHAQGMQTIGNTTNVSLTNETLNVYMCVANKAEQSYLIYVIFNNNTDVNSTGGVYSDGYENYIEPLLDSVTLKEDPNAPEIYDILGMDQSSYQQYAQLISQVKKGNQTAIQQLASASG